MHLSVCVGWWLIDRVVLLAVFSAILNKQGGRVKVVVLCTMFMVGKTLLKHYQITVADNLSGQCVYLFLTKIYIVFP